MSTTATLCHSPPLLPFSARSKVRRPLQLRVQKPFDAAVAALEVSYFASSFHNVWMCFPQQFALRVEASLRRSVLLRKLTSNVTH